MWPSTYVENGYRGYRIGRWAGTYFTCRTSAPTCVMCCDRGGNSRCCRPRCCPHAERSRDLWRRSGAAGLGGETVDSAGEIELRHEQVATRVERHAMGRGDDARSPLRGLG